MTINFFTLTLGRALHIPSARLSRILTIGIPIIMGMLSQSLLNLVDAVMVGNLGPKDLAAVGIGSYASFLTISLVMGLSAAVQTLVARRMGAGESETAGKPLMAGLILGGLTALPLTLLFLLFSTELMSLFSSDRAVLDVAEPYFEWRTLAIIAVAFNFCFRGYWAGIGETKTYLKILLWMHIANVVVSYVLIFGVSALAIPAFGAVGSGMGTCIALFIGTVIYLISTLKKAKRHGFSLRIPSKDVMKSLARLAIPNSLQQGFFSLGISVLFIIIGLIGTEEQAIGHILITLSLLLILPSVGLGIAATSLVSHSLGAKNSEDAYQWGWEVVRLTMFLMLLLGLPIALFADSILRLFTNDEHLIALGTIPLQITGISITFEVTAMVLTQALLGAGASRKVLAINIVMQWGFLLPLAYLIGPILGYGLLGIWGIQSVQRISSSLLYASLWRRRSWISERF
jgi:MATE family multidrug resistance protein